MKIESCKSQALSAKTKHANLRGQQLRELGLKATPNRIAILEYFATVQIYLSAEETFSALRHQHPKIGLPTVYRILGELSMAGVIYKILHPNRKLYYFYCPNPGHHHHFVCLSCRTVTDIDFCLCEQFQQITDGIVQDHIIQASGLCRNCAGNNVTESG